MKPTNIINIKILSLGDPERYAVRRLVLAAEQELSSRFPNLEMKITEVNEASEIGKFAYVLVLPTLIINDKVVCSGRFPTREEVVRWLSELL